MVDYYGNRTSITYDRLGRRTVLNDPDLGVQRYRYNAYGELVWSQDGNGHSTTFQYDALGRLTMRHDRDGTAAWCSGRRRERARRRQCRPAGGDASHRASGPAASRARRVPAAGRAPR